MTSRTTPSALAAPQSPYTAMERSIYIAHIITRPPPNSAGVT